MLYIEKSPHLLVSLILLLETLIYIDWSEYVTYYNRFLLKTNLDILENILIIFHFFLHNYSLFFMI